MSAVPLNVGNGISTSTTPEMVVSGDELENTENPSLLVGVTLAVGTCVILAFALISCIYFRKWKYRRRPAEDAAFYMNAGFDDFPQGPADLIKAKKMKQTAGPEVFPSNGAALCTLSDLPPHPAADLNKPYPYPYQLDPQGYVEQNLFASHSSPSNSPQQVENNGGVNGKLSTDLTEVPSPDILYTNPGAKDKDLTQGTEVGIADGAESGYETIDLKDSPDEGEGSFIMANPAAFKEYV